MIAELILLALCGFFALGVIAQNVWKPKKTTDPKVLEDCRQNARVMDEVIADDLRGIRSEEEWAREFARESLKANPEPKEEE